MRRKRERMGTLSNRPAQANTGLERGTPKRAGGPAAVRSQGLALPAYGLLHQRMGIMELALAMEAAESRPVLRELHTTLAISETSTDPISVTVQLSHAWCLHMESDSETLRQLSKLGVCPNCGNRIPEGTAVVRGPGSFCSLSCVASYYSEEFSERSRRLARAARQKNN
jgi:hypothetical protein